MDKIDILYRYYNDTFELSREAQKNRGKYFIYLCIIIAIQFMFIYDPSIASAILKALFIKLIDANVVLNIYILQTWIRMQWPGRNSLHLRKSAPSAHPYRT